MIPLIIPPIMKVYPLEESYLLPDGLFCHPISYLRVSSTLLLFFPCILEHTSRHMTYCCVLVCLLFYPESLFNHQISHQPFYHACICFNFCKCFFSNPCQGRFSTPKRFVAPPPPPLLHAESRRPIGI